MIPEARIKDLEKQGYRIVGNHSAIKVCHWCKKSLRCEGECYKNTFYGIKSWQCVQMTPSVHVCTHRCSFCWRDIGFTSPEWTGPVDEPEKIIDGCIKEHGKYLIGFGGNDKADEKRFFEAQKPLHFAISLSGEPTSYPMLPELIDELHKRKLTSFLVTNGTNPDMLKQLINVQPTQLYITLPASNKTQYEKTCAPLIKDGWEKILESLQLFEKFSCRKAIRLTLVKGENLGNADQYADLLRYVKTDYIELKAFMLVGYSRYRNAIEAMPRHEDILLFAGELARLLNYKMLDQKPQSRVVLIGKKEYKNRIMNF